tara:strand:- start:314 stop:451 length:138 start_codon:yes stop_codon:yes gene_type:complete
MILDKKIERFLKITMILLLIMLSVVFFGELMTIIIIMCYNSFIKQ